MDSAKGLKVMRLIRPRYRLLKAGIPKLLHIIVLATIVLLLFGIDTPDRIQVNVASVILTKTMISVIQDSEPSNWIGQAEILLKWLPLLPARHSALQKGQSVCETPSTYTDCATLFFAAGDSALSTGLYGKAFVYYRLGSHFGPSTQFDLLFKLAVSSILSGNQEAKQFLETSYQQDNSFKWYELKENMSITGSDFRLILSDLGPSVSSGTRIAHSGDEHTGILWTNGEALTVVSVTQGGDYILKVNLRHRGTPPIIVELGIDGHSIRTISLERGDYSWEEFEMPVSLATGLHTIHLRFLNDILTEHASRDAEVAWVELLLQSDRVP